MSEKKTSEAHKADELRGLHDTEEQARGVWNRRVEKMTCWCDDCCHNRDFECQLGANVEITADHECDSFVDYLDTEIYEQPFYRRVEHDGVQYKRKCYGKREEQNGIVFYHLAKELSNGTFCTEEKSGLGFEYRRILYDNYLAEMKKRIKQISSVNTLPDEPEEGKQ